MQLRGASRGTITMMRSTSTDKALQSYNRSLELDPEYGYAWFSKGVTLQSMQHYDEAKECFEKALRYDLSLSSSVARTVQPKK